MQAEDIIIQLLKTGATQPEISERLQAEDKRPNSLSSIEKLLKSLRKKHGATTMFQLGYIFASMENESTKSNNKKTKHMNTAKSEVPESMSPMQCEIENINVQLGRVERAIATAMENFLRFNEPANKLNPDDFFRNAPQNNKDSGALCDNMLVEGNGYVKSGQILKLSELHQYAKVLEMQVENFTNEHIVPVSYFFARNI